jgi:predicted RNA binding protein YcfA (HicA-like mRNA interferase family)
VKASEVTKKILARGGRKLRQKGSHARFECACARFKTTVPMHGGELGLGLLKAIEKDLEECFGQKWLLDK